MQDGRQLRPETIARFLAGLRRTRSGCWLWTRGRTRAGYGLLKVAVARCTPTGWPT